MLKSLIGIAILAGVALVLVAVVISLKLFKPA